MNKRLHRLIWLLPLLCTLVASTNVLRWLQMEARSYKLFDLVEVFGWSFFSPVFVSFLAALIISRQPHNRVGWLLALPALATATSLTGMVATLTGPPERLTLTLWLLLWINGWGWIPAIFPIFLIFLHFPTGRPPSPRWNWVNWLALGMALFFIIGGAFITSFTAPNDLWVVRNPIGFISLEAFEGTFLLFWFAGLIIVLATSVISLFLRYRSAGAVEREQIKWLLYSGAMFVVVYASAYFIADTGIVENNGWFNLFFFLSILAIPLSVAVAILRYRLWDIDIIIRKTLQYSTLTALLALIYFGSVLVLQNLILALTGAQSAISIVLSTLLIAALFSSLRRRVQAAIDRRFFRKKYDVQQALAGFAHTARDEVDLDELSAALLSVVHTTVQPHSATLWLAKRPR